MKINKFLISFMSSLFFGLSTFAITSCVDNSESTPIINKDDTPSNSSSEETPHVHTWDDGKITIEATCIEAGEITYSCTSCDEVKFETIAALGHTEVVDQAVAATCTEKGKTEGKHCSVCEEVLVAQEEVPALGHTGGKSTCTEKAVCTVCNKEYGEYADHNYGNLIQGTASSCEETGMLSYYECNICNKYFNEAKEETTLEKLQVSAKGHTEVIDAAVAPTCTEKGKTEGKHCSVCEEVLVAQEEVPALGHTEAVDVAVAPTCTEKGKTEGKHCSVCEEVLVAQEEVPDLGHTEAIDAAVAPTCTEKGKTEGKHCSVCEEVLVEQEDIHKVEHTYVGNICSECGYNPYYYTSGLQFTLSEDGESYSVTGYYDDGRNKEVVIPLIYNDKLVTSIGNSAFYGCSSLTSVTIPDSVASIGNSAFYGCSSLTSVTIGEGVTSIDYGAFYDCNSLEFNTYSKCLYLGNTNNPYLVLVSTSGMDITSCEINENTKIICGGAFSGCSSLTSITIPDGVTSIGEAAFSVCISLENIMVNPNNKVYDSRNNCNAIIETANNTLIAGCKNTIIPDNVTSIGICAFSGCSSLTNITIPDSVTSIGNSAFYGCSSLTSVTIGEGVTSIDYGAFYDCNSLEFNTYSKCLYLGNTNNPYLVLVSTSGMDITSCEINENTKIICGGAFHGCSSLTSVTIGEGVTSIGEWAFSDCSSLESITIPDSVTSIGNYAFLNCSSLTNITIPDSVTSIGNSAFHGCSSLTSVTIGEGVTSIGEWAFSDCSSLESITIPDSVTSIGNYAFLNCSSLTNITIPDSVTSIGGYAFYGCSSLTSITIPDGVTSIGSAAFSDCSSLESITIPDGVTSIGSDAFSDCSSLESITIPDSVTSIGNFAFDGCSSLTRITIPDSVLSIGGFAFYKCSSLETVYYTGTEEQWNNITFETGNDLIKNANIVFEYNRNQI